MTHPPEPRRIPPNLVRAAIARIVARGAEHPADAARRFLTNARAHGIDPTLCWGTISPHAKVRQVCLVVPGSGRTANVFLSPGPGIDDDHTITERTAERAAVLRAVSDSISSVLGDRVAVLQSLPEPGDVWARSALEHADYTHCGELRYLRARLSKAPAYPQPRETPGVRIARVDTLGRDWQPAAIAALEASYEGSLDCPELCGLRQTRDVLDSHLDVGTWDPTLWWVVFHQDTPAGVAMFNALENASEIELVYIGLAPSLRGHALGSTLLRMGMHQGAQRGHATMTCAVDKRNAPALHLYENHGFRAFTTRAGYIRRVRA